MLALLSYRDGSAEEFQDVHLQRIFPRFIDEPLK
jgi:hypothetical protein